MKSETDKLKEIKNAAQAEIEKAIHEEDWGRAGGLSRAMYRYFGREEIQKRAESPSLKPEKRRQKLNRNRAP